MSELSNIVSGTAAKVFADARPSDDFDTALWAGITDAGLDRVLLPEALGGAGDAFEAAVAIARAAGAAAASVPICETIVANWALAAAGLAVADGPKALVAATSSGAGGEGTVRLDISGRLAWSGPLNIAWATEAVETVCIVPGMRPGDFVVRLPKDFPDTSATTLAGEPCLLVTCPSAGLAVEALPLGGAPEQALAIHAVLQAAAMSGAMQSISTMTIEYANTRRQFGRPIGAFQAVQHMAARLAQEAAATEAAVAVAARELGGAQALWAAAVAKGRASEAAGKVAALAHQIHGAIGFTMEHALQRYTRRLWAWREQGGSEAYWYDRIGRAACIAGRDGLWPGITGGMTLASSDK